MNLTKAGLFFVLTCGAVSASAESLGTDTAVSQSQIAFQTIQKERTFQLYDAFLSDENEGVKKELDELDAIVEEVDAEVQNMQASSLLFVSDTSLSPEQINLKKAKKQKVESDYKKAMKLISDIKGKYYLFARSHGNVVIREDDMLMAHLKNNSESFYKVKNLILK